MYNRTRLKNLISDVAGVIILGMVYFVIYHFTGHGIPCVFRYITGLKCPGCGMTHAMHSLLTGDFISAFSYNPLSVTVIPVLIIYFLYRAFIYVREKDEDLKIWEYIFIIILFIITIIFTILRNIK